MFWASMNLKISKKPNHIWIAKWSIQRCGI